MKRDNNKKNGHLCDKKLLLLGPRLDDPAKIGGMIVSFENLLKSLDILGVSYTVIDTNSQIYRNMFELFWTVSLQLYRQARQSDHIFMYATTNHLISIGTVMVVMKKLFGIKISISKNNGRFDSDYRKLDFIRKAIARFVLRHTDRVYFETKYLVEEFKKYNVHTYWFPNIRPRQLTRFEPHTFKKRFVFFGFVTETKGVDELLSASRMLDASYTVDIYGPIREGSKYSPEYLEKFNVRYRGIISPQEVMHKLKEYDVVVLPSYDEGYPGIFLEAFSLGIPVLATQLRPIKEIVQDRKNGILVRVRDEKDLYRGFLAFDENNYPSMAYNAFESFDRFDALKVTVRILHHFCYLKDDNKLSQSLQMRDRHTEYSSGLYRSI